MVGERLFETDTVWLAVPVQPVASVTVTEKSPAVLTVIVGVDAVFDHKYCEKGAFTPKIALELVQKLFGPVMLG